MELQVAEVLCPALPWHPALPCHAPNCRAHCSSHAHSETCPNLSRDQLPDLLLFLLLVRKNQMNATSIGVDTPTCMQI